ncbi:MAG: F0F1 ATP synthase subunit A [Armatimonadota bacterium]
MDLTRLTTTLLANVEPAGAGKKEEIVSFANVFGYFAFVLIVMFVTIHIAKKGVNGRVFKGWLAGAAEQLYLFIENMVVGTMGPKGRQFMPFIATFWLVIFFANVISLFFAHSPTADLSFNLGMALISIGYVQYQGIKANGLFGHIKHFAGPKLGGIMVLISGMIFIIELLSEILKNLSLSLRLYGNIFGGHEAAEAISNLAGQAMHLNWFPAGTLLVPIKLLACVVQAMIFSLLTCVYISLVSHHDHDEDHGLEAAEAH